MKTSLAESEERFLHALEDSFAGMTFWVKLKYWLEDSLAGMTTLKDVYND